MIKLIDLLKEARHEDDLNSILDKISTSGKGSLSREEKKWLKDYSAALKTGKNPADVNKLERAEDFDRVMPGEFAKFKKDSKAEYKIIDKFYGREYDTKGKKYDTISTLGFAVDPNSDIAKKQGDMFGGEGEIASLRNALKNPSPLMMSDEKFDDMEFIVAQTPNMSQPRIYRYGNLYVPI